MDKDDIILKPKGGNKKLTKVKKEIVQARKDEEYKNVVVKTDLELKVDKSAIDLIKKLKYFQDRMHNNNPTKAYSKKRLYYGIREVLKRVNSDDVKVVIVARDFETFERSDLILKNELNELITQCKSKGIELYNASTRSKISHSVKKPGNIAVIGITDYQGAQELLNELRNNEEYRKKIYESVIQESFIP